MKARQSIAHRGETLYQLLAHDDRRLGQAERNSTDSFREAGTSARVTGSKPNLGKNRSAVVVSRKTVSTPRSRAIRKAASVSWWPSVLPRNARSTARLHRGALEEEAERFLGDAGLTDKAVLAQIDGRFMSAFVRARKPLY